MNGCCFRELRAFLTGFLNTIVNITLNRLIQKAKIKT